MQPKTRLAVLIALILWASAYVGIRAGLHAYSPEGLALLRYLVASAVMVFIYYFRSERNVIKWQDKCGLLLVGIIGIGLYNVNLNYGEMTVSSGVASFIVGLAPIFSAMLAIIFLRERVTATRVLGFLICMLGVTIIAYGEMGEFKLTQGMLYVVAAMFSGGLYSFLSKYYTKKCTAIESASYVIWGGTLFCLIFLPFLQVDLHHAPLFYTAVVIYLGIFPAALAYLAWNYILGQLTVSQSVSFLYLLPFITSFMGWLLLDEVPSSISVSGAFIALCGVWVVNKSYQTASANVTRGLANEAA